MNRDDFLFLGRLQLAADQAPATRKPHVVTPELRAVLRFHLNGLSRSKVERESLIEAATSRALTTEEVVRLRQLNLLIEHYSNAVVAAASFSPLARDEVNWQRSQPGAAGKAAAAVAHRERVRRKIRSLVESGQAKGRARKSLRALVNTELEAERQNPCGRDLFGEIAAEFGL